MTDTTHLLPKPTTDHIDVATFSIRTEFLWDIPKEQISRRKIIKVLQFFEEQLHQYFRQAEERDKPLEDKFVLVINKIEDWFTEADLPKRHFQTFTINRHIKKIMKMLSRKQLLCRYHTKDSHSTSPSTNQEESHQQT